MKRLATIFLLLVLAVNVCGYRLLIGYLNGASEAAVEKKADQKDYQDCELVSVKTILHLPYYTGSSEFERAYGSVNINGQDYEYVKRRVHRDTLELLCLPNLVKTKLKAAGNELAKASADGNASTPAKKSPTTVKINLPDFYEPFSLHLFSPFVAIDALDFAVNNGVAKAGFLALHERPPQVG